MTSSLGDISYVLPDQRFEKAIGLFNTGQWYSAHDAFEELWHESDYPERSTLQGLLQIAVAQFHLQQGNKNGATILYGEGLGRLKKIGSPDLGLDIEKLCECVNQRLLLLQKHEDPDRYATPYIHKRK